jgi:hypothetical protein
VIQRGWSSHDRNQDKCVDTVALPLKPYASHTDCLFTIRWYDTGRESIDPGISTVRDFKKEGEKTAVRAFYVRNLAIKNGRADV